MKQWFRIVSLIAVFSLSAEERGQDGVIPTREAEHTPSEQTGDWVLDRKTWDELPIAGHVGSMLEFLYPGAVVANTDTGGFARAENIQFGVLGESYKWQRWFLEESDISNPSAPGEPLVYLPLQALSRVSLRKIGTLSAERNGVHLDVLDAKKNASFGALSFPLPVGGPHFIPRAVADREPAQDWGAPESSRGYALGSFEASAFKKMGTEEKTYLFADAFYARRTFNSLTRPENALEATLMAHTTPQWMPNDSLNFFVQARSRENQGVEFFEAQRETMQKSHTSGLFQYSFASDKAQGALALGYAFNSLAARSTSLDRSAVDSLIAPPASFPQKTHTAFVDALGFKRIKKENFDIEYGVQSRLEFEHKTTWSENNFFTESLYGIPLSLTRFDADAREANALLRWQPFVRLVHQKERSEYRLMTNAHIDWGMTDRGTRLGFIHPALALSGKTFLGTSSFFIGGGALHDTLGFSLQEISFLNQDSLSGKRFLWNDANSNGSAEDSELSQGERTGGAYHSKSTTLQAPQKEELHLNFGYAAANAWRFELNFNGRLYRQLFEVRYKDGSSPLFTPTSINNLTLFNKTQTGNEEFVLTNSDKPAYYMHMEIAILKTNDQSPWIFSGTIGAYFSAGYAPQGLGMFYNDPGAYNETTADPNFRENRFGRLDNDRGYIGKVIFGRRWLNFLSITNVLRYRDGESLAPYSIVTGLAQGPILVPTQERGGGLEGIGRHTYSLAWDVRVRIDTTISGNKAWFFLDIYNLLNSRTELAEYPLKGTAFRDPVEQGIQRTLRVGCGMNF